MTEVKVRVEDELLAAIGQDKVEQFLRDMVAQLHLKAAAQDALVSLNGIDVDDPTWKQARDRAWNKYVTRGNS